MVPWLESPTIEINLNKHINQRFRDVPQEAFEQGRCLLRIVMNDISPFAEHVLPFLESRIEKCFLEESQELAIAADLRWQEVLLANVSYDLSIAALGCSTVALAGPDGPVVARNMDWWPERELAHASYLMKYMRDEQLAFVNAGWPGTIGAVTGLSGKGFAIVLNAVLCPEGVNPDGYPVMLMLRRVLEEADSFDEALSLLSETKLAAPGLITLVGSQNQQRVVIERTPTQHALRWAVGDSPLVATNDYRMLFSPHTDQRAEIYQTTCSRYDTLTKALADRAVDRPIGDDELLYLLSDPLVIQGITAQHILMRPAQSQIRLFVPRRFFTTA